MKAQIWSLDLSVSVTIFLTVIVAFLFTFNLLSADASRQSELFSMQDAALEITEALVRSPGLPQGWTNTTVQAIGLAEKENVLNESKVLFFLSLDYNQSKVLLSLTASQYLFQLEHPNSSLWTLQGQNITKGLNYTGALDVVSVERYALLQGKPARLRFLLWR